MTAWKPVLLTHLKNQYLTFRALAAKWYWTLAFSISVAITWQLIWTRGFIIITAPGWTAWYLLAADPALAGFITGLLLLTTISKAKHWLQEQDRKAAAKLLGENLDTEP